MPPHDRRRPSLARLAATAALRLTRWRIEGAFPANPRCVAIGAPHTSWFDFILTLELMGWFDLPLRWVGKDALFRGPLGPIMRRLGGVPVDRSVSSGMVEQLALLFADGRPRVLAISPEGTRRRADHWRTGFYRVAERAGVPIVPVRVEAHHRVLRILEPFWPSGDVDADFARLAEIYSAGRGVHPERAGPVLPKPTP